MSIFQHINTAEVSMYPFIPFIHTPERKKENEPLPLHIELYPPIEKPQQEEEEEKDEGGKVIIIELL